MSTKAKAYAALIISVVIGAIGNLTALGVLSGSAQHFAVVVTSVVTVIGTTIGVYQVPNSSPPPSIGTTAGPSA